MKKLDFKPLFSLDSMEWKGEWIAGDTIELTGSLEFDSFNPLNYELIKHDLLFDISEDFFKQSYLNKIRSNMVFIEKNLNNIQPNIHASLQTLQEVFDLIKTRVDWLKCPVTLRMGYDKEYLNLDSGYSLILAYCLTEEGDNGEVIDAEIVFFSSASLTIGILLHELAHIKHQDHSEAFESTRKWLINLYNELTLDNIH